MVTKKTVLIFGIAVIFPLIIIYCRKPLKNKEYKSAKVLFYENFEKNSHDKCILVTSHTALRKYTNKNYDIDFDKNSVLIILKPWSSTYHEISFKDIYEEQKTLIVRYIYEVTNMEVEGPPKKFGLLIPKVNIPVKVIEHFIEKEVESISTREYVVENQQ